MASASSASSIRFYSLDRPNDDDPDGGHESTQSLPKPASLPPLRKSVSSTDQSFQDAAEEVTGSDRSDETPDDGGSRAQGLVFYPHRTTTSSLAGLVSKYEFLDAMSVGTRDVSLSPSGRRSVKSWNGREGVFEAKPVVADTPVFATFTQSCLPSWNTAFLTASSDCGSDLVSPSQSLATRAINRCPRSRRSNELLVDDDKGKAVDSTHAFTGRIVHPVRRPLPTHVSQEDDPGKTSRSTLVAERRRLFEKGGLHSPLAHPVIARDPAQVDGQNVPINRCLPLPSTCDGSTLRLASTRAQVSARIVSPVSRANGLQENLGKAHVADLKQSLERVEEPGGKAKLSVRNLNKPGSKILSIYGVRVPREEMATKESIKSSVLRSSPVHPLLLPRRVTPQQVAESASSLLVSGPRVADMGKLFDRPRPSTPFIPSLLRKETATAKAPATQPVLSTSVVSQEIIPDDTCREASESVVCGTIPDLFVQQDSVTSSVRREPSKLRKKKRESPVKKSICLFEHLGRSSSGDEAGSSVRQPPAGRSRYASWSPKSFARARAWKKQSDPSSCLALSSKIGSIVTAENKADRSTDLHVKRSEGASSTWSVTSTIMRVPKSSTDDRLQLGAQRVWARLSRTWGPKTGNSRSACSHEGEGEDGTRAAKVRRPRLNNSWGQRLVAAAYGISHMKERTRDSSQTGSGSGSGSGSIAGGGGQEDTQMMVATPDCAMQHPRPSRTVDLTRFTGWRERGAGGARL